MERTGPVVVYLDYNVMVGLFDGRTPLLRTALEELLVRGAVLVPFTREHVVEAVRGADEASEAVRNRARWLLDEMSTLCRDWYIFTELKTDKTRIEQWSPHEVYEETVAAPDDEPSVEASDDPLGEVARVQMRMATLVWITILNQMAAGGAEVADLRLRLEALLTREVDVNQFSEELMEVLVTATSRGPQPFDALGLNPREMNNEPVETLVPTINAKLSAAGSPLDLEGMRAWLQETAPSLARDDASWLTGMLGPMGYHRDKAAVSAASRVSDLGHATVGLRADLFVTDDRRLRERARAAAHQLRLPVLVLSISAAEAELRRMLDELVPVERA